MPALDRPSAISASTSCSRGLRRASGSWRRRAFTNSCSSAGSITEPLDDPLQRLDELVDIRHPALQQVADPLAGGQQFHRMLHLCVSR